MKSEFNFEGASDLLTEVAEINDFRNTYVAHQEKELTDTKLAKKHLSKWIVGLKSIVDVR